MSEREIYHEEKIGYAISHGVDSLAVTFIVFFLGGGVGPGRRINVICNRTNGKNPLFFFFLRKNKRDKDICGGKKNVSMKQNLYIYPV